MDSNTTIALCSIIIALAALLATIWQGRSTYTHNKLSVKPLLNIEEHGHPNRPIKLELCNKGVGPALIKQYSIILDGKEHEAEEFESLEIIIHKIGIDPKTAQWDAAFPGYSVLLPGESISLLAFRNSHEEEVLYDFLLEQLPRINFLIEYECIYKTQFTLNGRSHLR